MHPLKNHFGKLPVYRWKFSQEYWYCLISKGSLAKTICSVPSNTMDIHLILVPSSILQQSVVPLVSSFLLLSLALFRLQLLNMVQLPDMLTALQCSTLWLLQKSTQAATWTGSTRGQLCGTFPSQRLHSGQEVLQAQGGTVWSTNCSGQWLYQHFHYNISRPLST